MSSGRFAILDPAAGISGDMLLGALVANGASAEWITGLPARLGIPGVKVELQRVYRSGIEATQVTVRLPDGTTEGPSYPYGQSHSQPHRAPHHHHGADGLDHGHDHQAGGHADHRHVGELIGMIERAPLSTPVRDRAIRAFRLLAEAEGRIHGVATEDVALHEVGAMDALVDIVGAIEGFEQLGIERVYHRPVTLGAGWVRAAHGVMPVPAPVTALLLEGLEIGANGPVTGEATTPTGAVLLRVLSEGTPPARWRMVRSGWGAGSRDPAEYPNALRLLVAEAVAEAAEVVLLATDLDDLSPEYVDPLRDALVAAGALDVQVWTVQMKKGRPGFRLEAAVAAPDADRVTDALFRHSTTAGVRRWTAERVTLPRHTIEVSAGAGVAVRVKVIETPAGPRAKPEYDDIRAAAQALGRPAHEVAREIQERAQLLAAGARPAVPNSSTRESE